MNKLFNKLKMLYRCHTPLYIRKLFFSCRVLPWHVLYYFLLSSNKKSQNITNTVAIMRIDGIGDLLVCIINVGAIEDIDITKCLESAYNEIKNRTGYLNEHGAWIKDTK